MVALAQKYRELAIVEETIKGTQAIEFLAPTYFSMFRYA